MKSLNTIAISKGTDKSSEIHNYCVKYEKWLPFNRLEPLSILEIGVLGGASLATWREYYPSSIIVGIDIDPSCKQYEDPSNRIFIEIGSQDDVDFLESVAQKWGPFDMILDDGSHVNRHVIASFNHLIDYVKPECVYVIEDTCTAYWEEYEGGFRNPDSSIEFAKNLVDDVNFNGQFQEEFWNPHGRREDFLTKQTKEKGLEIRTDIESVNFLNSITIITKR
jgi:hypothetical protein